MGAGPTVRLWTLARLMTNLHEHHGITTQRSRLDELLLAEALPERENADVQRIQYARVAERGQVYGVSPDTREPRQIVEELVVIADFGCGKLVGSRRVGVHRAELDEVGGPVVAVRRGHTNDDRDRGQCAQSGQSPRGGSRRAS